MKKCPDCEKMNNAYAGTCEFCGADIRLINSGGTGYDANFYAAEEETNSDETDFFINKTDVDPAKTDLTGIYAQLDAIKSQLSRGLTLFDVNMPFSRMVMLFIKVLLASIPAILIVGFLFLTFWTLLGGLLFNVFFRGYGPQ